MKTSVARTWRKITSKLHPPLPVSPRDSQRLLSLLNTSFQQQLDREHLADSSGNEHYTNLHLQSILTDPLFDAKPRTRTLFNDRNRFSGKSLRQLQDHINRPMDAFKERVSRGTADLGAAKLFLSTQYKICMASPAATPRAAMQSSGAASMILQWLWSSGLEDTGLFLMDQSFVALLVPFLLAEGQHSRIVRWLHRCSDGGDLALSSPHGLDAHRIQALLFPRLINQELKFGGGLESAITLYLQIVTRLRSSESTSRPIKFFVTQGAWILTNNILRFLKAAEREPSNLEPFFETTMKLTMDPLLRATQRVYFQKPPNPQAALTYFQHTSVQAIEKIRAKRRPHIVLLGMRAAEMFLHDGRQPEALWIMEFLQANFAHEIGSPLPRISETLAFDEHKKLLKREEKSLQLLGTLAVQ